MRQVDRASVDVPPRLLSVTAADTDRLRAGEDASDAIYRHADVLDRLIALYLGKCYLCEAKVDRDPIVEHFLPWHRQRPERAYEWKNLNLACSACNQRKKRAEYAVRDEPRGPVVRTNLIDPSCPPYDSTVESLLAFQRNLRAYAIGPHAHEEPVAGTVRFLNDGRPLSDRLTRFSELLEFVYLANCKTQWEELSAMASIDAHTWTGERRLALITALRHAHALFVLFLSEDSPFYTALRHTLPLTLRISVSDFARISAAYETLERDERTPDSEGAHFPINTTAPAPCTTETV